MPAAMAYALFEALFAAHEAIDGPTARENQTSVAPLVVSFVHGLLAADVGIETVKVAIALDARSARVFFTPERDVLIVYIEMMDSSVDPRSHDLSVAAYRLAKYIGPTKRGHVAVFGRGHRRYHQPETEIIIPHPPPHDDVVLGHGQP